MEETKRATIYFDAHAHHISDMVNEAVQITLAEDADDLRDAEIRQTEESMDFEDFIGALRDSGRL
jgi:hypothetical protein